MGQSFIATSQTTKAHDMSTAPRLIFGFLRVATNHKALSISKPLFEYTVFSFDSLGVTAFVGVVATDVLGAWVVVRELAWGDMTEPDWPEACRDRGGIGELKSFDMDGSKEREFTLGPGLLAFSRTGVEIFTETGVDEGAFVGVALSEPSSGLSSVKLGETVLS
jgi:hypothetical protein